MVNAGKLDTVHSAGL